MKSMIECVVGIGRFGGANVSGATPAVAHAEEAPRGLLQQSGGRARLLQRKRRKVDQIRLRRARRKQNHRLGRQVQRCGAERVNGAVVAGRGERSRAPGPSLAPSTSSVAERVTRFSSTSFETRFDALRGFRSVSRRFPSAFDDSGGAAVITGSVAID